jgi:lysophospholipase L1-like esterase
MEISRVDSTVSFGSGPGTIDVVVTTGDAATALSVVAWGADNEPASFTWQNVTQAADTTVTYVISGNFVSDQAKVALANMTNDETITADYAVYQGETTDVDTTYNNAEATNFAVYGSGVQTVASGNGPDTLTNRFVNLTGAAQVFDLLVDLPGIGFYGGLTSAFTIAAHTTLDLSLSGAFDVHGLQPTEVIYAYTAGDIDMISAANDGAINPGQTLVGTNDYATDFGPATDTTVVYGAGPDEIVLKVTGLDGVTQFAVGSSLFATGPLETNAIGSTTETVDVFGTFSGKQVIDVADDESAFGDLFTGGESRIDANSGVVVQSISYGGSTITPNATVTAAAFQQAFTISPASRAVQPANAYAAPLATVSDALVVDSNGNPAAELANFLTAYADGDAMIIFMGDSTTAGIGTSADAQLTAGSAPDEFNYWLNQDGVGSQIASVEGNNNNYFTTLAASPTVEISGQTTLSDGATYNAAYSITGPTMLLYGQDSQISFSPDDPIYANQIEVQLLGAGADPVQVSINGTVVVGTINASADQLFDNDTINLPQGQTITNVTLTQEGSGGQYIEGIETNNTASSAIKVINAGASGETATGTNYQQAEGDFGAGANGPVPNVIAQDPSLVFLNLGINDMDSNETMAAFIAAEGSIVADFQAKGIDVVLESPTPWADSQGANNGSALVAALGSLAAADGIPFLDLNTMFGGGSTANLVRLQSAGFFSPYAGDPHLSAGGYALVGQAQASFIASLIDS